MSRRNLYDDFTMVIIGFGVLLLLNSSKSNKSDCCLTHEKT